MMAAAKVLIGFVLIGAAALWLWVNGAPDNPADWHVDPATTERSPRPNDFVMARSGATASPADAESPIWGGLTPEELLARFDAHALAQPRVERLAGSPEERHATYIARSAVWGFPDYITVRTTPAERGAAIIIWARARYGYSDLGVNRTRIQAWLQAIAPE